MAKSLGVGDRIPDSTLLDQDGQPRRLLDLCAAGPLVLFFYPKDETAGCTAEACAFRDEHEVFVGAGAQVAGVSDDDAASHRRFASRHSLPYTLLVDRGGDLRTAFGVKKTFGLLNGRVTYVIDKGGVIRHEFSSQLMATRHVTEALAAVRRLAG